MSSYDDFINERIEIGAGMVAKVYSWNGYAYKCFNDGYPKDWLEYELNQQAEVCKTDLPIPRYYESEFSNTIKMDLITGDTMFDRLAVMGKDAMLDDFMLWFQRIHAEENLKLHSLPKYLLKMTNLAPITDEQKTYAKQCLDEVERTVSEKTVLCHMDYHMLNVMYEGSDIHIIDWVNAKMGKKIWDYARTYVVCYEFAAGLKRNYQKRVMALEGYPEDLFMKAVYVNAVYRLKEHDYKRIRQLIKTISSQD